jgi:hypothetical protein
MQAFGTKEPLNSRYTIPMYEGSYFSSCSLRISCSYVPRSSGVCDR